MTLTQLVPPYPIFTDKSGTPLDNGYLYFGTANLNPETNPITVYYDRGFTQPVAQPVRTSAGYVMRNGSPAAIYANGEFSVTVRDKKKALVIYSPVGFGVVPGIPFATFDNAAKDVTQLLANTTFTYSAGVPNTTQVAVGDILRTLAEGFAYAVAASGATDNDVITAGGVKLYVQAGVSGYNVKAFGAIGDGVVDDRAIIAKVTNNAYFPSGVYRIASSYTHARGKTWTFGPDARIYVVAGVVLTILGDIDAAEDQWVFDCQDTPTNYSDPNGYRGAAVTTTTPVILGGAFYSAGGFAGAVSVKWFGATGAGFTDPSALSAYDAAQILPSNLFTNDTKAIRFALTAICGDYNYIDQIGSQRGATGLFFPDGVYTVDDELFFGAIALYGRTPQSPVLGCKILQTNADKSLFVVQGAGRGGLGGGGSSSQIVNLALGYRFSSWNSAKKLATLYFVENKFNLDTYITGCRFNNIAYQQQVVWWSEKEARAASPANIAAGTPQYGYGAETGLIVTLHFNQCMFDVGTGRTFRVGEKGAGRVEVNDSLFYDYPQGLIFDELKVLTAGAAPIGGSVQFKFNNCDFQDIGQFYNGATGLLPNENFMYSRNAAGFYWFNGCENQNTRSGYNGAINIQGGGLRMNNCVWETSPTGLGSNIAIVFRNNGAMTELTLLDNEFKHSGVSYQAFDIGVLFAPTSLDICGNRFTATSSDCIIYIDNPATSISGVAQIKNNYFGAVATQPIIGNTNPSIIFEGNIFATKQDVKAISLRNYGMKGRTEIYAAAIPVSGAWYQGDRVIKENPSVGQPKAWRCTVSGTPGTWVSEGNL